MTPNKTSNRTCLSVLVDNAPGVLARVVGLFSGRGYNIESLTVDRVNPRRKLSRMTIVTKGQKTTAEQIAAQLCRLIPIREVKNLSKGGPFVEREIALVKLSGAPQERKEPASLLRKAGAKCAVQTKKMALFELSGAPEDLDAVLFALQANTSVEIARSGSVALSSLSEKSE